MTHFVCKYTPIELLTACGADCRMLDEAPENFDLSDQIAHPNLCGFGKSVLQAVLSGKVRELVLVNCCDTIRSAYDILSVYGNLDFLYLLDLLHGGEACSIQHTAGELKQLIREYCAYRGTAFDKEKFRAAFQSYTPPEGDHLLVLGAKMGQNLFSLVQETMPLPVENATCAALRTVEPPEEVDDFDRLLEDYARNLLHQIPCMRMTDPTARRTLVNRPGLSGVIYHTLQFCDFYGFEYAALQSNLPVPMVKIESDGTTQSREQLRTRLGAFAEGFHREKGETDMDRTGFFAGIDSGSSTTDVVILDKEKNIVSRVILPTGAGASNGAARALETALQQANLTKNDLTRIVTTGYGRGVIQSGDRSVTEITCHAKGAHFLNPKIQTVIDIGGQDSKVIRLDEQGGVKNFVMNDKCAAGTGRFLDMMARTLDLTLEEISTEGLNWKEDITISSMCTVFADSEVVSLVAQNKARPDIVHGLNNSVAVRCAALYRRVSGCGPVMMTGGVSRNQGVVKAIEEKLGETLFIHPDAQLCGALGAALFAWEG